MADDVLANALSELDLHGSDEVSMLTAITHLSRSETLSSIIQTLLAHPTQLTSALPIAINHANGFFKLVLATNGRAQIRLHLWPKSDPAQLPIVENAHNHRWSFATKILQGSYTETTYQRAPGSTYARYAYSHEENAINYQLEPVETCDLTTTGIATYAAGSMHWIHPEVIHRVSPVDPLAFTATLLVVSPSKRQNTDVFASRESTNAVGYTKHRPLTNEEITDSLTTLAAILRLYSPSERPI